NQSKSAALRLISTLLFRLWSPKGHEVAVCFENKGIGDRQSITIPEGVTTFFFASEGAPGTLRALCPWAPDVLNVHGLVDWRLEEAVLAIAQGCILCSFLLWDLYQRHQDGAGADRNSV